MPNKNKNVTTTTIPRDLRSMEEATGNLYESIVIISKRANQIAAQTKEEIHTKIASFHHDSDTLEEVFENREQIEMSMTYERQPKPTLVAIEEFLDNKVYHRNPIRDTQE